MIKVFLSHQKADSGVAAQIASRLKSYHQIDSYLDVIDLDLNRNGEDLAQHIRQRMTSCTQLLAIVSEATKLSWWVPWEIGVATEKEYPLATYAAGSVMPPEYLRKWPYLRSDNDLDHYAAASKSSERSFIQKSATLTESASRRGATNDFYSTLRASLRQ